MDNYLVLNGKRIDLTEEQIKKLDEEYNNDYFKKKRNKYYYYIGNDGKINFTEDCNFNSDELRYNIANYCTNKELIEQRALHETLDRLLWRFSMQNDGNKIDWSNSGKNKYSIYYDIYYSKFEVNNNVNNHYSFVYYYTKEIAQRAINEIIIPFMEKHPEFVW